MFNFNARYLYFKNHVLKEFRNIELENNQIFIFIEKNMILTGHARVVKRVKSGSKNRLVTVWGCRFCVRMQEKCGTFVGEVDDYLFGNKFKVRTDHNSLIWLMRFKNIEGQLARWVEELQNYDM